MKGNRAIAGAFRRLRHRSRHNASKLKSQRLGQLVAAWDDVADDGWEDSRPGPEWSDAAEPMDDDDD